MVRSADRSAMTIDVDWDVKQQKQTNKQNILFKHFGPRSGFTKHLQTVRKNFSSLFWGQLKSSCRVSYNINGFHERLIEHK